MTDLQFYNQRVSIVGIYGPSPPGERADFFDDLFQFLPTDGQALLVVGDFNVVFRKDNC